MGIPADKLDKLFINFGNLAEHQKINQAGRGLGLSICKSIVEQMGGVVKVTSQENVGSVFAMIFSFMCRLGTDQLPPEESKVMSMVKELSSSKRSLKSSNDEKPFMLFVNDDEFLLFTYKEQLQSDFQVD